MRKTGLLVLAAVCFVAMTFATSNSFSFKVGYYMPNDLPYNGIIWGADYGYQVDENVEILASGDLYVRSVENITEQEDVEKVGVNISQYSKLSEWSAWHLPLTFKVRVSFPMDDNDSIKPFVLAGLGYGITHVSFTASADADGNPLASPHEESITYNGFVWQVGGGVKMRVGSRSNLIGELIYNSASFDKKEGELNFSNLDSSGMIIRAGINVILF